jgi:hypothetical protein
MSFFSRRKITQDAHRIMSGQKPKSPLWAIAAWLLLAVIVVEILRVAG